MSLRKDAISIAEKDPAARNTIEVMMLYPGYRILKNHRKANFFYRKKMYFLARWISQCGRRKTGIEIHPAATIGKGLFIDHGMGVVIGETAVIGDNCTIYHGVTLGGTGKETGKRHPTIGNNVMIGAGAKVLGPVNIGNNVRIGANTTVLCDVEDNSTIVGPQGKVVKKEDIKVIPSEELDQIHLPDPTAQITGELLERINKLEEMLSIQKNNKNQEEL